MEDCDCLNWFIYIFHYVSNMLLALKEMTLRFTENLKNQTNIYPTKRSNSQQIHTQVATKTLTKILQEKWTFLTTIIIQNSWKSFKRMIGISCWKFATENKIPYKQHQNLKFIFLELYYSNNACFEYNKTVITNHLWYQGSSSCPIIASHLQLS